MKSLDLITQGLKTVYSGEDCKIKHVGLFALAGIMSLVVANFQTSFVPGYNTTPNVGEIVIAILILLISGLYMNGYNLQFMHNVHHNEELPNLDGKPILALLKSIPLVLVWIFYFGVVGAICSTLLPAVPILGAVIVIAFIIFMFCYPFIFVAFSKEFKATGLFNPFVPIKFLSAIGLLLALMLCFIVLNIIVYIPIGVIGGIIGFAGGGQTTAAFVGAIFGGYIGFVMQLVFSYCLVQIYKERFEQSIEEEY